MFKGEVLNREEQPSVTPETAAADDQVRKPRRTAAKSGAEAAEKPQRTSREKGEVKPDGSGAEAPAEVVKAPAKRVRKAGTTDAATN